MKYNPQYHNRRSNRLQGYDYSQAGMYFITICTHDRECMFGEINEGKMMLNEQGNIANEEWFKTNEIRKNMDLDVFVVMPNHIHGIVVITHNDDSRRGVLHTPWNENPNPFDQKTQIQENIHVPGVCNIPTRCVRDRLPLHSPSATIAAMVRGYKYIGNEKDQSIVSLQWFCGLATQLSRPYYTRSCILYEDFGIYCPQSGQLGG
jgi:hypothetical protein